MDQQRASILRVRWGPGPEAERWWWGRSDGQLLKADPHRSRRSRPQQRRIRPIAGENSLYRPRLVQRCPALADGTMREPPLPSAAADSIRGARAGRHACEKLAAGAGRTIALDLLTKPTADAILYARFGSFVIWTGRRWLEPADVVGTVARRTAAFSLRGCCLRCPGPLPHQERALRSVDGGDNGSSAKSAIAQSGPDEDAKLHPMRSGRLQRGRTGSSGQGLARSGGGG